MLVELASIRLSLCAVLPSERFQAPSLQRPLHGAPWRVPRLRQRHFPQCTPSSMPDEYFGPAPATSLEEDENLKCVLRELNLAMKDALWGGCEQLAKRAVSNAISKATSSMGARQERQGNVTRCLSQSWLRPPGASSHHGTWARFVSVFVSNGWA